MPFCILTPAALVSSLSITMSSLSSLCIYPVYPHAYLLPIACLYPSLSPCLSSVDPHVYSPPIPSLSLCLYSIPTLCPCVSSVYPHVCSPPIPSLSPCLFSVYHLSIPCISAYSMPLKVGVLGINQMPNIWT